MSLHMDQIDLHLDAMISARRSCLHDNSMGIECWLPKLKEKKSFIWEAGWCCLQAKLILIFIPVKDMISSRCSCWYDKSIPVLETCRKNSTLGCLWMLLDMGQIDLQNWANLGGFNIGWSQMFFYMGFLDLHLQSCRKHNVPYRLFDIIRIKILTLRQRQNTTFSNNFLNWKCL